MGETLLSVRQARRDGAVVVSVFGEADLLTADQLTEALEAGRAEASGSGALVADLTGVTFLGSAGLAELIRCHRRCKAQGTSLHVVATAEQRRILDITGLTDVLTVTENIDDVAG
jgi:anti-sigma B factor antagonist